MLFLCAVCLFGLTQALSLDSSVHGPPKITLFPTSRTIYFNPRYSTQIDCEAVGNPDPVYKWYRNSIVFDPSGTDNRVVQLPGKGTLQFTSTEENDEGYYQCTAENSHGVSVSPKLRFRAAKLGDFWSEPTRVFNAPYGNALTLPCLPPVSIPHAEVTWVIHEDDVRVTPVQTNDRVVVDREGRLRILSVEPWDEHGGRSYSCMVTSTFLKVRKIGPDNVVKVLGGVPQYHPAYEFYSSPDSLLILRGTDLELQFICAGNPLPTTHWQKLDGTKVIPDRATYTNDKLVIPDADIQDGGMYKAVCSNDNVVYKERSFVVAMQAAPTWITGPSDVTAQAGSTVTITCEADGIPAPLVDWFVNGVDINTSKDPRIQSSRFQQVDESHVILTNLQLTDHMNIQCNATNKWGYAWGDVYINVV